MPNDTIAPSTSAVEVADILQLAYTERDDRGDSYIPIGPKERADARAYALGDLTRLELIGQAPGGQAWWPSQDAWVLLNQLFYRFLRDERGRDQRTVEALREAAERGDEAHARSVVNGTIHRYREWRATFGRGS